jgi:predicted kinase
MLVVFGGLPGTGKTELAKALAQRRRAAYLRVDAVEQALRVAIGLDVGASGYAVAQAIAHSNLAIGLDVVADCVNPVPDSRRAWRQIARTLGRPIVEVELVCSDTAEHRRRVETRCSDIEGLVLPTWSSVEAHPYIAWTEPHLVVDTALLSFAEALDAIATRTEAVATEGPSGPDPMTR